MNTQEIYALANKLTEKEVETLMLSWGKNRKDFVNSLVRLGDSLQLAFATVLSADVVNCSDARHAELKEFYRLAYEC